MLNLPGILGEDLRVAASVAATESGAESVTGVSSDANSGTIPREIGGRDGPDPTRYGDWEKNGRCIDF